MTKREIDYEDDESVVDQPVQKKFIQIQQFTSSQFFHPVDSTFTDWMVHDSFTTHFRKVARQSANIRRVARGYSSRIDSLPAGWGPFVNDVCAHDRAHLDNQHKQKTGEVSESTYNTLYQRYGRTHLGRIYCVRSSCSFGQRDRRF